MDMPRGMTQVMRIDVGFTLLATPELVFSFPALSSEAWHRKKVEELFATFDYNKLGEASIAYPCHMGLYFELDASGDCGAMCCAYF